MKKIKFTWYKNMSELNKHRLWKYLFYLAALIAVVDPITAVIYDQAGGENYTLSYTLVGLYPILLFISLVVQGIHLNHPYPKKKSLS